MERFDVFLSHNRREKEAVREIWQALRQRGLNPWLDEEDLIPGRSWQEAVEEVIRTVPATAVLVGKDGLGPWEIPEMRACLTQFVNRQLPVIPVLLPGASGKPELPLFLGELTWIDLRDGITRRGIDRLIYGITGTKPVDEEEPRTEGELAPQLHNLPFESLGSLFQGRAEEIAWLEAALAAPSHRSQAAKRAVLRGLGGIGKTRLAVEYAWRHGGRYRAVFFARAESRDRLRSQLALLAGADLLRLPERDMHVEEEVYGAVLSWLRENPGWLLILDDADTDDGARAVSELLPRLHRGQVLITSRLANWPAGVVKREVLPISAKDAEHFLLNRTNGERRTAVEDAAVAARLVHLLGGLPLALEQATAYIAHLHITFAVYLDALEHDSESVLGWYDGRVMGYPYSVAVTWQKTLQRLGPGALAILRLATYLATDPIPVDLFEKDSATLKEAVALATEAGQGSPPQGVQAILADLAAYSMIQLEGATLTVHRMVQDVTRIRIPAEQLRAWAELAIRLVDHFSPASSEDIRSWPIWDLLRSHAAEVIRHADHAGIAHPTARLADRLGGLLKAKGLYAQAEPLLRRALTITEQSFGPDHPEVGVKLNNLAQLLHDTNRLAEAEPLMRRALVIDERVYGSNHPNVAIRLNNLGMLLAATNRLAEAEPLIWRALAIDEASYGGKHPRVGVGLHNLAALLHDSNRLAEAEPLMRRALAIDEEAYGPDHPQAAIRLGNLANLLQITSRLDEAEPLMRRALAIDEESYGPDHPSVALRLNNLALLLKETNRLTEVEPLLRRALAIENASYGEDHPRVACALNNLAQLLRATNRPSEAEPLMRQALDSAEAAFVPGHYRVATCLSNLAMLLKETNRAAEAEPLMRRALVMSEASLGVDHPEVASALWNLGDVLWASNRLAEAETLVRRALGILKRTHGLGHPMTQSVAVYLESLIDQQSSGRV
jgi:tetratricopeptide (TPR) repeat protein